MTSLQSKKEFDKENRKMEREMCRFCFEFIPKANKTAHYRKKHKENEIREWKENERNRIRPVEPQDEVEDEFRIHNVIQQLDSFENRLSENRLSDSLERLDIFQCIICLENHSTKLWPCSHSSSCEDCLLRWWQTSYRSPKCPMCRSEISSVTNYGVTSSILVRWREWRTQDLQNEGVSFLTESLNLAWVVRDV